MALPDRRTGAQIKDADQRKIPPLLLYLLGPFIGFVVATQYVASVFLFNPLLGKNFFHIYNPLLIKSWWETWPQTPEYRHPLEFGIFWGVVAMTVCWIQIAAWRGFAQTKAGADVHGSARWANKKDIERAGLIKKEQKGESVLVGMWKDKKKNNHYLWHDDLTPVLCVAPTRAGKGVSVVTGSLLSWVPSVCATDIKGELWAMTAGWRRNYAKNTCMKFQPAHPTDSVKWNPIAEIRIRTQYETGDVQNLVRSIVEIDGKPGQGEHWVPSAEAMMVGCILHMLYLDEAAASLENLDAMLSSPDRSIDDLWAEMMTTNHREDGPHPVVASVGRDMTNRKGKDGPGILSTALRFLSLWRDPIVARNTSSCDFKVDDLMNRENPMSLYIVTSPEDLSRLRPIIRLLKSTILRKLCKNLEFVNGESQKAYKHKLLIMWDEFPSFGKVDIVEKCLAYMSGYGMKAYIIIQDFEQLQAAYGENETITSQCEVIVAFPPNPKRLKTAEELSRMTGGTTHEIVQRSISGGIGFGRVSQSWQKVARPLLTPDEVMRMPGPEKSGDRIRKPGKLLIFTKSTPAIYGEQPLFFLDSVFLARSKVPAPATSDKV